LFVLPYLFAVDLFLPQIDADFHGLFFIKTKNNGCAFLYLTLSAFICVNLRLKYF